MEIICTHCEREFDPTDETNVAVPFCGTYCEQSWWMSPTASKDYEKLLVGYLDKVSDQVAWSRQDN